MTKYLVLTMLLGFGSYCSVKIYEGFRTGEMQLLIRGGGPYLFRKFEPGLFWATAFFNIFLAACMFASIGVMLVREIATK